MAKQPTIDDLKKELASANKRIAILDRNAGVQYKVKQLLIAAGLVSEEKFSQAEDLLDKDE